MKTKSTKRTTANTAIDVEGRVIRLLATRLTSNRGYNTLLYSELRRAVRAVSEGATEVNVLTGNKRAGYETPRDIPRKFGRVHKGVQYLTEDEQAAYNQGPVFNIGCHVFTLKMFNRILRAAGIATTEAKTLKKFRAAAGR